MFWIEQSSLLSFFLGVLRRFQRIASPAYCIWLVNPMVLHAVGGLADVIGIAKGTGIEEIGLRQEAITAQAMASCQQAQLRLGAYAAHDTGAMTRMLDLGVSVFTTDDPVSALRLRQSRAG